MNIAEDLDQLPAIYFPSEGNVDAALFSPLAKASNRLDCMVGYFTSGCLSELSLAVSSYLNLNGGNNLRFIISPSVQKTDLIAIERAYSEGDDFFELLFPDQAITAEGLKAYAVKALAYLVVRGRIELKVALKDEGIFHTKCWLFSTPLGHAAIHGSSNATTGGMIRNFEQLVLSRSWLGSESQEICKKLNDKFEEIWENKAEGIRTIGLNEATLQAIQRFAKSGSDQMEEYRIRIQELIAQEYEDTQQAAQLQQLAIPSFIQYEQGEFAHQGEAVRLWFESGCTGIMAIATGGGKTYTSLIAATKLCEREGKLLTIIAVPTKALMTQWQHDVSKFAVEPINTVGKPKAWIRQEMKRCLRNLRLGVSKAEAVIITHDALGSGLLDELRAFSAKIPMFLIADEVHNLGTKRTQQAMPDFVKCRLGLSATHERQFDEEGTQFLVDYFGGVVYEYGLDKAIGSCLVNYNYYAHIVYLSAEEEEDFQELTQQIRKVSYAAKEASESAAKQRWQALCLRRRKLVETAAGKIEVLFASLPQDAARIAKTLIFCTDKAPAQMVEVNEKLNDLGLKFHQVTADETSDNELLNSVIRSFSNNELQVLTSKRVLDEGFNVPQTETAYLLASNTVQRQWVQRLGRILRLSPETNKSLAYIHDFVVLPVVSGEADDDLKSLLESEYRRVSFFSKYSSNFSEKGGACTAIEKLLSLLGAL